jgi:formylglycine-generating enzyme required for sulfatase activity
MTGGRGTFIAFATSPGKTASDNPRGQNGLFTYYLLDALTVPGLSLNEVFDTVRGNVDAASGGRQLPWTLSSVVGRYVFSTPPDNRAPAPDPVKPPANVPEPRPPAPVALSAVGQRAGETRTNSKDGLTYVWIPAGKFMMGCSLNDTLCGADDKPRHQVTLTKGFWMGQTEVTQGAFKKVIPLHARNDKEGPTLPGDNMSWNEATTYCGSTGMRLPTEAEWEYAARAGTATPHYGAIGSIAWYHDNSNDGSHEVGQKQPNAFGLYDMIGNVWEHVYDWFGPYPAGAVTDPRGPASGKERVMRGGSYNSSARLARASTRLYHEPSYGFQLAGFRCAGDSLP